jgi:endonuclease/exonuclease/phosphatase (EEP) superfamily protein YafD
VCWLLAALWAGVALARWLGYDGGVWPIMVLPALIPYLTVGAVLPVAVCLLTRRWYPAGVALAALAVLVALVAPRAFGSPDPARGPALRVLTANLNEGGADPQSLVALVRDQRVDVLALSELPQRELDRLTRAGLDRLLPYAVTNPGETTTGGTALFSRYPISDGQRIPLTAGFIETAGTVLIPGARPVRVTAVHYCAPGDPGQVACWNYGRSQLPPATPDGPVRLLLGDFNMTVDYAALRALLDTGYRDAASVVGQGLMTTWPEDGKPFLPVSIDHVLADRRIGVTSVSAYPVRRSDHRAVFAALTLPGA